MLLTPINVQTHFNSVSKFSDAVSFNGTKSKIDPYEAIPSVRHPLGKTSIPNAKILVPATQMMFSLKQALNYKYTRGIINSKSPCYWSFPNITWPHTWHTPKVYQSEIIAPSPPSSRHLPPPLPPPPNSSSTCCYCFLDDFTHTRPHV